MHKDRDIIKMYKVARYLYVGGMRFREEENE
jgi:hypothetical protein